MYYISKYNSPLGVITVASDGEALSGLWFDGQKYFADRLNKKEFGEQSTDGLKVPVLKETEKWLDIYFSGKVPDFTPDLNLNGVSPFRKRVWKIILKIPYGKLTTYGQIAKKIEAETGKRVSAQAVGGAVGHNPISLIIPCHRVVGANGGLTGYAGGLDKKTFLLKLEGSIK